MHVTLQKIGRFVRRRRNRRHCTHATGGRTVGRIELRRESEKMATAKPAEKTTNAKPAEKTDSVKHAEDKAAESTASTEELRCVLAVIRHGDRTPKQKLKMPARHAK